MSVPPLQPHTPTPDQEVSLRIGVLLFPGFQVLDVFGPLDCLNVLSRTHPLTLSLLSHTLDPVTSKVHSYPASIAQSILPTHTFSNPPPLDVLLVPGGLGTRLLDSDPITSSIAFIRSVYPSLRYLITVCTGSGLAARAGILDGRRATTNKRAFREISVWRSEVEWVAKARWVVDGNLWTSSGVSSGIDVILAWIGNVFGEAVARGVADGMEYRMVSDEGDDPFATLYGLE
ncbi:class I glutamine amidotransferase-like protein [Aspergillus granulosus]|uniref:Class I glutamine amidotransferase-like protein n=1 Tax=Aspergillus granulosus TaxID=176169 RepID=A0ABR4H4V6_9EURO